jgi:hypothetical protein
MTDTDIRKSSCYLILERPRWRYDPPRIVTIRATKPKLAAGQVAVKVVLSIPMGLFDTFIPVVEAEIREGDFLAPEIEIEPVTS